MFARDALVRSPDGGGDGIERCRSSRQRMDRRLEAWSEVRERPETSRDTKVCPSLSQSQARELSIDLNQELDSGNAAEGKEWG